MASIENEVTIVLLHADAEQLTAQDWGWLGIPEPTSEILDHWATMIEEAKQQLSAVTWIDVEIDAPLHDVARTAGERLAEVFAEAKSLGRSAWKPDVEDPEQVERRSSESLLSDEPSLGVDRKFEEGSVDHLDHPVED